MKAKKWLTILTFICTLLGVIFCLIFNYTELKIGYDLSLATFGSSLLGFIMSLAEYFVERRKAMENFWLEARIVLKNFRKLQPVCVSVPKDLLLSCFFEEEQNESVDKYGEIVAKSMGLEKKHDSRERLLAWMEQNEPMSFTEDDDIDSILNEVYQNRIQSEHRGFEKAINEYVEFSEIELMSLDNAYGNLDFIFANKKIRQVAYDKIFNQMRSIRNAVLEQAYHFRLCSEGKGSFIVCAKKVLELNEKIFVSETKQQGGIKSDCIYQKEFDEIEDNLEKFRVKIYLNAKEEKIEHHPVVGRVICFEEEKEGA